MDSIEKISLFKTLFYISLITAIVFLVLSIVLFFVFKIPQIYMMRTGRAQKKSIEKMKKINSETGRLESVSNNGKKGMSQIFGSSSQLDATAKTALLMDYNVAGTVKQIDQAPAVNNETEILNNNNDTSQIQQSFSPIPENTLNQQNGSDEKIGETTVLSEIADSSSEMANIKASQDTEPDTSFGPFEIIKQIIEIHTDETIA